VSQIGGSYTLYTMKSKTAMKIRVGLALAILVLMVAVVAFSGYFEDQDQSAFDMEFIDIKIDYMKNTSCK